MDTWSETKDSDEKAKLLPVASGIEHSGGSIESCIKEPPDVYGSRWRSIRVMYGTMFLSCVSFSICVTSVWPYLQRLDKFATTDFLGWVVASYSFGQFVASPLFGWWSNKIHKTGLPIVVSLVISVFSNLLYAYLQDFSDVQVSKWMMVVARTLIGVSAGNTAIVRSYVSGATTVNERTAAMANIGAFQAIGFIIGPAIQAAVAPLGFPGPVNVDEFRLNLYTAPAWLSAVLGVVNLVMIVLVFAEHRVVDNDLAFNTSIQGVSTEMTDGLRSDKPDYIACALSLVFFFVTMFTFGTFETIATPLTEDMYNWSKEDAALYCGLILAGAGLLSIFVFAAIKVLSKRVNERYLILTGFLLTVCAFLLWLPWGDTHLSFQITDLTPSKLHEVAMTTSGVPNSTVEPLGCPVSFTWCTYTPRLHMAQFFAGITLNSVGYPVCNVLMFTLYSKILGPNPQGTMMGWLTSAGSAARVLGPICVSQLYAAWGPRVAFSTIAGLNLCTVLLFVVVFKRMVPFNTAEVFDRADTV